MNKVSICILHDKSTEKILDDFAVKELKTAVKEKENFDYENSEDMKLIYLIIKLHSFDKILKENKDENNLDFFKKELILNEDFSEESNKPVVKLSEKIDIHLEPKNNLDLQEIKTVKDNITENFKETEGNHKNVNLYQFSGKNNNFTTSEENLKLINNLRGRDIKEFNIERMNSERSCEFPGQKIIDKINNNNDNNIEISQTNLNFIYSNLKNDKNNSEKFKLRSNSSQEYQKFYNQNAKNNVYLPSNNLSNFKKVEFNEILNEFQNSEEFKEIFSAEINEKNPYDKKESLENANRKNNFFNIQNKKFVKEKLNKINSQENNKSLKNLNYLDISNNIKQYLSENSLKNNREENRNEIRKSLILSEINKKNYFDKIGSINNNSNFIKNLSKNNTTNNNILELMEKKEKENQRNIDLTNINNKLKYRNLNLKESSESYSSQIMKAKYSSIEEENILLTNSCFISKNVLEKLVTLKNMDLFLRSLERIVFNNIIFNMFKKDSSSFFFDEENLRKINQSNSHSFIDDNNSNNLIYNYKEVDQDYFKLYNKIKDHHKINNNNNHFNNIINIKNNKNKNEENFDQNGNFLLKNKRLNDNNIDTEKFEYFCKRENNYNTYDIDSNTEKIKKNFNKDLDSKNNHTNIPEIPNNLEIHAFNLNFSS